MGGFVAGGLAAGHRVICSVPAARGRLLRDVLGADADRVRVLDMAEIGRNPSNIISEVQAFLDGRPDVPVTFVGEPIWAGRSAEEVAEATRHEALINLAFAGHPIRVLCPYDAVALHSDVLADAWRTHPTVQQDLVSSPSSDYADPETVWRTVAYLPPPPAGTLEVELDLRGLAGLRRAVSDRARAAGLNDDRVTDLLVATGEVVTNALRHGGRSRLWAWAAPDRMVVEVRDGWIVTDPLVGRLRPEVDGEGGWGLWLVNQLCDLVQLHADDRGTTTRLHVRR